MSPIFSAIDFKSGSLSCLLAVFLVMGPIVIKIQLNFHYLCTISQMSQKEGWKTVLFVFILLNFLHYYFGSSFFFFFFVSAGCSLWQIDAHTVCSIEFSLTFLHTLSGFSNGRISVNQRKTKKNRETGSTVKLLVSDVDSKYTEVTERQRTLLILAVLLYMVISRWASSVLGPAVWPGKWVQPLFLASPHLQSNLQIRDEFSSV